MQFSNKWNKNAHFDFEADCVVAHEIVIVAKLEGLYLYSKLI